MSLSSTHGALVASVVADSPALKAGIKSGDVVRSVDGKDVDTAKELTRMISAVKPGDSVKLGLWRDGKDMTVTAKVGDQSKSDIVKANAEAPDAKGRAPTASRWRHCPATPGRSWVSTARSRVR